MKFLGLTFVLMAFAGWACASEWSGFYALRGSDTNNAKTASPHTRGDDRDPGACIRAILEAQERHGIPGNILLGIGLQEAGTKRSGDLTVWPWAVNAAGVGRFFEDREEAIAWVRDRLAAGVRSIDVGCMQINLRWHPDAFLDFEQGFDPTANADYAARFLRDLYRQTGDWTLAAGSYHSFTPDKRERYLKSLRRNVRVANQQLEVLRAFAGRAPAVASSETTLASSNGAGQSGLWSASLSDSADQGRKSLYSTVELKPILPKFQIVR